MDRGDLGGRGFDEDDHVGLVSCGKIVTGRIIS